MYVSEPYTESLTQGKLTSGKQWETMQQQEEQFTDTIEDRGFAALSPQPWIQYDNRLRHYPNADVFHLFV